LQLYRTGLVREYGGGHVNTARTYTTKQLADLAGVSVRALHHYDEIGLLRPKRRKNGYRAYGPDEVNRLQLILVYRASGMKLAEISRCIDEGGLVRDQLVRQRERLMAERERLDGVIATVDRTIADLEGSAAMRDDEKFEGFKRGLVDENERKYGSEVRERYGNAAADEANERVLGMTREQYDQTVSLEADIKEALATAMATGDPTGSEAARLCDLHRRWLCRFWGESAYSRAAHAGLAEMYLADNRFRAYYDAVAPGATQFLHDAILAYCAE
jgi:DNA-binding transcriptional MerR regulator